MQKGKKLMWNDWQNSSYISDNNNTETSLSFLQIKSKKH